MTKFLPPSEIEAAAEAFLRRIGPRQHGDPGQYIRRLPADADGPSGEGVREDQDGPAKTS